MLQINFIVYFEDLEKKVQILNISNLSDKSLNE